jgi:hypothetical protein
MMGAASTHEYRYLWDGSTPGWVLLRDQGGPEPPTWTVFNLHTYAALIIEDDEIHAEVCREMLTHGVPVLDGLPPRG